MKKFINSNSFVKVAFGFAKIEFDEYFKGEKDLSLERKIKLYEQDCLKGNYRLAAHLGLFYETGYASLPYLENKIKYFYELGSSNGDLNAMSLLANFHFYHKNHQDKMIYRKLTRKAILKLNKEIDPFKNMIYLYSLSKTFHHATFYHNFKSRSHILVNLIEKLALLDVVEFQYTLSLLYQDDKTFVYDNTKQLYWLFKAAENDDCAALAKLSTYYKKGYEGFPKDSEKSRYWLEKLALQGDVIALYELDYSVNEVVEILEKINKGESVKLPYTSQDNKRRARC